MVEKLLAKGTTNIHLCMYHTCNDTWDASRVIGVKFGLIIIIVYIQDTLIMMMMMMMTWAQEPLQAPQIKLQ